MGWRVARCLDVLLAQLNAHAPHRSRTSDGSIGDANHANRSSDHNPWYGPGIVTARDFTHDPAAGLDCHALADSLVRSRDPRIKYVIWRGRILDSRPGFHPWSWRPYNGPNRHDHHLHLSATASPACDDNRPWSLDLFGDNDIPSAAEIAEAVWARILIHPTKPDQAHAAWIWLTYANDAAWQAANGTFWNGVEPSAADPHVKVRRFDFARYADMHALRAREEIAELRGLVAQLLHQLPAHNSPATADAAPKNEGTTTP